MMKPKRSRRSYDEAEIRRGIELLFFAYRDFTSDPDRILEPLGMGRAHHRVIHFVGRNPGMTVGALLTILKITKQSLNRVLGQLVREGYIVSRAGTKDRRERLLTLTAAGSALERRLFEPQRRRVGAAFENAQPGAVAGFSEILLGLVNADDRSRLAEPKPDRAKLSARRPLR
jgi:DNA-binding MarR family transcriptional regulator